MASRIASSSLRAHVAAVLVAGGSVRRRVFPRRQAAIQPPFLACLVTGTGGPTMRRSTGSQSPACTRPRGAGWWAAPCAAPRRTDYVRELRACARDGAGITIGVGYAHRDRRRPGRDGISPGGVRDRRRRRQDAHAPAGERRRARVQGAGGRLPGRLRRRAVGREARRQCRRLRRCARHPARRAGARGVPVRREAGAIRASGC